MSACDPYGRSGCWAAQVPHPNDTAAPCPSTGLHTTPAGARLRQLCKRADGVIHATMSTHQDWTETFVEYVVPAEANSSSRPECPRSSGIVRRKMSVRLEVWLPFGSPGHRERRSGFEHIRSKPLHFRISRGRWDRNRTCNLRFWRPLLCLIELPTSAKASAAYTGPVRGVKRKSSVAIPACLTPSRRND